MLALAATLGNAAVTDAGHAQDVSKPTFTKQAFDANGAPLTGSVSVGQTIQYVLSYNSGSFSLSPATIDDNLSPNLAYVTPSIIAPPGWTWNPSTPYSIGNHTQYSNAGVGPGTSFMINVPVAQLGQAGAGGGDGTLPIVVGNHLYAINHHQSAGTNTIMCWNLLPLTQCTGAWPRSSGPNLMTPTLVRHAVAGTRIYFPSASVAGSGSTATTTPGIGCWETLTDTACPFIPLPGFAPWVGPLPAGWYPSSLDPLIGGIAADPTLARLFMYAADSASAPTVGRVYCVPLSAGACGTWNTPTTLTADANSLGDMILEETSGGPAAKLYVTHAGKVTCLRLSDGQPCIPSWINVTPSTAITGITLAPVLGAAGQMSQVCLSNRSSTGAPACFDTQTAVQALSPPPAFGAIGLPTKSFGGVSAFRVPGTARVLYPYGVVSNAATPLCLDAGVPCASPPFATAWPTANNGFKDYGYAVDPAEPDRCLLGLGDKGIVWRFTRDGGFGATGCVDRVEQTFDINSFFCAIKPKQATWGSIVIHNRPPQLTGGTISLVNSAGVSVIPQITVGAVNTYPVNIPVNSANSQLTVQFTPTYSPSAPSNGYQLELTFTADVDPQICYKAMIKACGPVFNKASMAASLVGPAAPTPFSATAAVDLGNATGPGCEPGLLKVCKVAGPGIAIGTPFTFTAGSSKFAVPAGPAPGGTCVIGPTFPVGSNVTVDEDVPPGYTVSSIAVAPPKQLVGTPNLAAGSVNVIIGNGVTVVTFTDKLTGFLEICKKGDVTGNFSFTVSPGGLGPFVVPAGACSPPIEVIAGAVVITELPTAGITMVGCSTYQAGQQGLCDPNAQTSTVTVTAGDVSTETIAFITNRRK
jgi:hypothetical protein